MSTLQIKRPTGPTVARAAMKAEGQQLRQHMKDRDVNEAQTEPATHNAEDRQRPGEGLKPAGDLVKYCRQYAREKPKVVALCCLGIGFALGWKLKPW